MKITIRPKENVKEKISIDDIEPGEVFEYGNGAIGLKLCEGNAVVLKFSYGGDWFVLSDHSMEYHGMKILGKIDEIIVVENDN